MRIGGLAAVALLLAACAEAGAFGVVVVSDGEHRIVGEQPAAMIILGGEVEIAADARVSAPVWVQGGKLRLAGTVGDNLSVLGGAVELAPGAVVAGDLQLAGGTTAGVDGARVDGEVTDQLGIDVPLSPGWERQQPLATQLALVALRIGVIGALSALFGLVVPRPLKRVERAAMSQPIVAVALGILAGLVSLPLIVFMAFTVVLIPVAVATFLLLGLGLAYGLAALGSGLLRRLAPRLRAPLPLTAALGGGSLWLAAEVIGLVPWVGWVAALAVVTAALGAVLLTRLGTREASRVEG